MRILVSNDDGILSRGIHVLAEALKDMGEVTVVAPSQERSTNSHSLTLHKPLRITKMKPGHYHVNGTPADCVYLALKKIMKDELPDIVVSGINRGANLGYDVHYSGTVAAAREAAIVHIPSLAISLSTKQKEVDAMNFESAAQHAKTIVKLMQKKELPKGVFLNMNVPDRPHAEIKGIKVVRT
ncbi:MAG TPA: 5'/3'-nucleotidase SurE, partial [Bdellovibrionota bacterium]|nr:5'/3'-nucleotidase SurE [Bdellovibrionota bacterium]